MSRHAEGRAARKAKKKIDYGDERLSFFVMEIYEAFAEQVGRDEGDLNDIEFEDGILKINGEFDL